MKQEMNEKLELEATLLNTILNYSEAFKDVVGVFQDEGIFDKPEHRAIFKDAMKYFTEKGKAPSVIDLLDMLLLSKEDTKAERDYLTLNISCIPTENREAKRIAERLIDLKAESELRDFQSRTLEIGLDYLQAVSDKALEVSSKYLAGCRRERSNYEVAETVISGIMNGTKSKYIKTGFDKIDKYTNGIPEGHLTIVAARPGVGKTAFMLQLMRNMVKQNLRVGIFSLEMSAESLLVRNLSAATGIDSIKIDSLDLSKEEKVRLVDAAKEYADDNYKIIDLSKQTPATIKLQINLWKMRNQVDLVILDYMTLVTTDFKMSRQDLEIGKLSAELNSIAKTTGIPIIILSQLNRQSESRINKIPQLSDLRESGSIEQDASLVLLLYRPGLYGIDASQEDDYTYMTLDGNPLSTDEYFEVIIAKARNGRTGSVILRYRPEIHTFENVIAEKRQGERIAKGYENLIDQWQRNHDRAS